MQISSLCVVNETNLIREGLRYLTLFHDEIYDENAILLLPAGIQRKSFFRRLFRKELTLNDWSSTELASAQQDLSKLNLSQSILLASIALASKRTSVEKNIEHFAFKENILQQVYEMFARELFLPSRRRAALFFKNRNRPSIEKVYANKLVSDKFAIDDLRPECSRADKRRWGREVLLVIGLVSCCGVYAHNSPESAGSGRSSISSSSTRPSWWHLRSSQASPMPSPRDVGRRGVSEIPRRGGGGDFFLHLPTLQLLYHRPPGCEILTYTVETGHDLNSNLWHIVKFFENAPNLELPKSTRHNARACIQELSSKIRQRQESQTYRDTTPSPRSPYESSPVRSSQVCMRCARALRISFLFRARSP